MGFVSILFTIAFIGIVVYYLINRPSNPPSIGGGNADSPSATAYSPFGEPGKFSFETREFNGYNYVWKDGKWERTTK